MALIKCKECGKEVSSKAKTCPNCGVEIAAKRKRKRSWIILIILIITIISIVKCQADRAEAEYVKLTPEQKLARYKQQAQQNVAAREQKTKRQAEQEKATKEAELNKEQKRCTDSSMAYVMSQKFVKQRLKAPTTAKFPWSNDSAVKKQYIGDCKHRIVAYVDSQNSFGAMIRTTYYAELQYIKDSKGIGSWRLLDLQIEN